MTRTITAAERAAVAALRAGHYSKFEVQDADLAWRDYTAYLRTDWFTGARIREDIDQSTMTLNATLLRETGTLSLSPFRSDSLVNRNGAGSYATAIDLWRKWRVSVAVMREGYPPTGTDWKEICQGRIDVIEWSGDQILVTGRGEEAVLLDYWIATERQYGSVGGIAMETTLQSMWDNNLNAISPTLYTPASPAYLMNLWTQGKGKLFPASRAVSDKAGAVIRYRHDSSDVYRPTLFIPNRTAAPGSEVWTMGPSEITGYQKCGVDKQGIANFIKIRFAHPTLGVQTVISPWMVGTGTVSCTAGAATFSSSQATVLKNGSEIIVAGIAYTVSAFNGTTGATLLPQLATQSAPTFSASAFTAHDTLSGNGTTTSLSRFGRNDLEIDLSADTQVNDSTKGQGMADAIRSDTEFPALEQQFETLGAWFVQLHDYGKFLANGVHYDQDQYGGVTSIEHNIADATIRSTIGVRGQPAGAYKNWRLWGKTVQTGPRLVFAEAIARITATTATTVEVTVTANPASPPQQVQFVGVTGGATLASGTAAGVWVTPNGTNNVWVFNRPAFGAGVGQAQFRVGNTSAFPNDDDFVSIEEQGRDTVFLATRARVTATTPTTVTVRVAVADPYPQGAGSVSLSWLDLGSGGVSPSSPQSITPAATLTEAAGSFVDFTVTRPAFGAGAGRVTFTAAAAGRMTDSDAVDIPEVGRDTVYLAMRARVISQTATTVVARVAVADPYPQGAASATITYSEQNTGAATSPATGQTVTPAATLTEAAGTYVDFTITRPPFGTGAGRVTFTATAANRTTDSDAVDIPEVDRDTVYLAMRARVTATTPSTLTVRVAVADPYPQGAASATIGYSELGLGGATTPATGQTVTPAATLTEAAGTFVDYTVTRPAFGLGAGRITFTATAANRTSDSDAVDVPEVDRDTVFLAARARVTATTPTTVTVRVAVADPYPQGAASGTIAYQDLGSGGVSPGSGGTVTPASTLTEAAGTFIDYTVTRPAFGAGAGRVTFTATAANRGSSSDAVDVPEIDRDTQTISVRVLRISETADQVVVRVEAITPNAGATVTVNYDAGGLSISPATGGTFSATTSFGTTGHIDYTITRDTQGGSPRRVAFTVSASGFIDGTDGVDVPPNSTRERCKVVVTGSPTQTSGTTPTLFTNWTESGFWDIGGLHDDSVNPSRFTIQAGGNQGAYLLHASMAYQANANGDRAVYIHKNGTAVASCVVRACAGALNTTIISAFYFDNAPSVGDYYEVYIWQNSGSTLGVGGGTAEEFFSIIHLW